MALAAFTAPVPFCDFHRLHGLTQALALEILTQEPHPSNGPSFIFRRGICGTINLGCVGVSQTATITQFTCAAYGE